MTDLLSTVVAYLQSTPSVTALVSADSIHAFLAPAGQDAPFIVVGQYVEQVPGATADDQPIKLTVVVRTADDLGAAQAKAIGLAVKAALDTPARSSSIGRGKFVWDTGTELSCLRGNSQPRRMPGISRTGLYPYVEQIDYTFTVTPSQ